MSEEKEILWEPWHFPNIPLYQTKLTADVMDYLWNCISQAEKDNVDNSNDYSHKLAGNISGSLGLTDKDNQFRDKIVGPLTNKIIKEDPRNYEPPVDIDESIKGKLKPSLKLNWWVNYQYQTEFNPEHMHDGITSFVIWMKIPTHHKEQHNLPFHSKAASDFQFTYSNILGHTVEYPIFMSPDREGMMMLFPSTLHHQVYPFYNTDEPRITIAGNQLWNVVECKQE